MRLGDIKVEIISTFSDIIGRMRQVTLSCDRNVYPYREADIFLTSKYPDCMNISSFYVLTENLWLIRRLRDKLLALGYDLLKLEKGLIIRVDDDKPRELIPPVVEVDVDSGIEFIYDGLHRACVASEMGMTIRYIRIANPLLPAYAYPNAWSKLREQDKVPVDPAKKKLYRKNYQNLYRNLPGTSGLRL